MSRRLFFNNYGKHKHSFKAVPVAYIWDWLELPAPLSGAGCITINEVFMCFVRGTPAALKQGPFADKLGAPRYEIAQNGKWFASVGGP